MKLVIAVISQDKLDAVREALPEPDAYVFYVNLVGDVREPIHNCYRGGHYTEPRPRLRVEIVVVNEMLLDEVVGAVLGAASSDCGGNIFVLPLEDWIRIPSTHADAPCPSPAAPARWLSRHHFH
jgi:nitrogen regulatory protein PII